MDWPEFARVMWYGLAAVIGAVGLWLFRLIPVRSKAQIDRAAAEAQIEHDRQEAEAKAEKERAATERKGRRDTLDEYRELLRFKEKDAEEWRRQVHEVRGENQILQTRVATLGVELQQVRERLQDCEDDRQDLWDALEKAGIPVRHRRREVQIPRGPAPETDVSDEPE